MAQYKLTPVHCHDTTVTPFFFCYDIKKVKNPEKLELFRVDGCIGLLHREFEKRWLMEHEDQRYVNFFGIASLIDNFPEVFHVDRYIMGGNYKIDIKNFCQKVSDLLNTMPNNEVSLRSAFESGYLGGKPIRNFEPVLPDRMTKFFQFEKFVRAETGTF